MPRLTDRQRKKIIADYVELGSYAAVGRKHHVSATTVKALVQKHPETVGKCDRKKEENTRDVLSHMDGKRDTVCEIIDKALDVLNDRDKLSRTGPMQLAIMLGTVIDKFTATRPNVEKLRLEIAKTKETDPQTREDDPITKSLKEDAAHGLL